MRKIPDFLFRKGFLNMTVAFITLFSVIFMNIYTPFSTTAWFNLKDDNTLLTTIMFYILAVLFLLWSKTILHDISKKRSITVRGLLLYSFCEIIILSVIYTLFTAMPTNQVELISLGNIFLKSLVCISLILIIPYTICFYYGLSKGYKEQLQSKDNETEAKHLINIRDHKDKIKISLLSENILYIVSEDNYIKIFYEQENELKSTMVRTSAKSIEEELIRNHIIRCHRSYLVNINKIILFNNDRNNLYVLLNNKKINPIPVSRTCRELIETALSSR